MDTVSLLAGYSGNANAGKDNDKAADDVVPQKRRRVRKVKGKNDGFADEDPDKGTVGRNAGEVESQGENAEDAAIEERPEEVDGLDEGSEVLGELGGNYGVDAPEGSEEAGSNEEVGIRSLGTDEAFIDVDDGNRGE